MHMEDCVCSSTAHRMLPAVLVVGDVADVVFTLLRLPTVSGMSCAECETLR